MNHKKAQEGLMRLDLRYEESIKWSCWTPWIHHKTGPLLCHYRCSLLAPCCSKFFLWPALLLRCLWLLFAWAYVNSQLVSNEVRNPTGHMDCFNACLLWQKPWPIKWQGPTPCMSHKKAQGVTNEGWFDIWGAIKWSSWTPCIHHKTGPLLWPLQVFPAGILLLYVFPLAYFASGVLLASFCMSLCEFRTGFKWRVQPVKQHGLPQCMPALTKASVYKMTRSHPLHES